MSTVEFYSGISDKLHHALRLLRKAHAKGARVAVVADAATLRRLDAELWTADARDFVPHVRIEGRDGDQRGAHAPAASRMDRTPLWLVESPGLARRCDVLVNLGPQAAEDLDGFDRVIDLVGDDADDRRAGRARWRRYESSGHTIQHRALDSAAATSPADPTDPS